MELHRSTFQKSKTAKLFLFSLSGVAAGQCAGAAMGTQMSQQIIDRDDLSGSLNRLLHEQRRATLAPPGT